MKKMAILLVAMALFLLVNSAWAMSSTHYQLDWFTPLTASGGRSATSTGYAGQFSVGQTVAGNTASPNHQVCLGYWCSEYTRAVVGFNLFLPMVSNAP
jgi:hypothetical protein